MADAVLTNGGNGSAALSRNDPCKLNGCSDGGERALSAGRAPCKAGRRAA
jgi:hypothetical protein